MFCNCSSAYWSCVSMFHENLFSWGAYYAPDTLTDPFAPLKRFNKKIPHECGIFLFNLVGAKGFEPSTPWSQTKYSTRLSYAPKRELLYSYFLKMQIYFINVVF